MPRTVTITVAQPSRKNAPGHYMTIGDGDIRRGDYYRRVSGTKPNLLALPGVQGVQVRYQWRELETTQGTYTFGSVKATYPTTERTVRADLWRCQQNNSRLIILIMDRTFDGTNPMPPYLASDPQYVQQVTTTGGTGSGYSAVRWNATVQARFRALVAALGAAFDSHPNWYAVAFQETSTGLDADQRAATGYIDSGTTNNYRDALIANLRSASDSFPTSRVFWYQNFFPTPATDYRIGEVADAVKGYANGNHGIVMGGPDIMPDKTELATRCYPRYGAPPVGSWGELPLFCSMQFDSYDHVHTTASTNANPDPRMPNDRWALGDYWTMDQLFRFGRDSLHLNYVMWEHDQGGAGYHFEPDAQAVIAANPTFNT
jgi:hypothetical protein